MAEYDFSKIEKKWQACWEKEKAFEAKEDKKKNKFYAVEMYPYPSSGGLHIGHAFNYTLGDIISRFKTMKGFNVLHPMGFDSFGLPAENAAIKNKSHPKKYTNEAIKNFIVQQKSLGLSYDWTRLLVSHDPEYYTWDQWIFLKMFEKGLAYRKKSPVNWCSKCNSVLANEQVHGGACWRHLDTPVEIKHLEQWFFKITDYAEELYDKTDSLTNWPLKIKAMQKNWIGKSYGTEIEFKINDFSWKIFTTRPDTLFGVTFVVVSAQHHKLSELVTKEQKKQVDEFVKKIKSTSEKDAIELEKEGVFTGSYAIHPLTKEKVPVWAGNFVVADYGSGMVMAVPAHDERDFQFAKKYNIPIKLVIKPSNKELSVGEMKTAFTNEGVLVNSGEFNGLKSSEAINKVTSYLEGKKLGRKTVNYKLRDWLISRQRYWGTPIPIIYCDKCGIVAANEKDLPVELPEDVVFDGIGNPLATSKSFQKVSCPKCKGKARRETDTMDTFVNSSWYFLRYTDSKNKKQIFDPKKVKYWMPMDFYVGGAEHACMHLIYSRFYTKFFRDIGMLDIDEPTYTLFNQGMVHGEDGFVMSKSRGNGVDPLDAIKKYSADTLRMFLVSMASPDKDYSWSTTGIESMHRFVKRMFEFFMETKPVKSSPRLESKVNKAILEITEDIEKMNYNLAVIKLRQLFDVINGEKNVSKKDIETYAKLISPFAPHISEEIWQKLGNKGLICLEEWPIAEKGKIDEKLEAAEKALETTVIDITNLIKMVKEKQGKEVTKVYLYTLPNEKENYDPVSLSERMQKAVSVFAVNDAKKYDPVAKASKAKPGRPAIYLE